VGVGGKRFIITHKEMREGFMEEVREDEGEGAIGYCTGPVVLRVWGALPDVPGRHLHTRRTLVVLRHTHRVRRHHTCSTTTTGPDNTAQHSSRRAMHAQPTSTSSSELASRLWQHPPGHPLHKTAPARPHAHGQGGTVCSTSIDRRAMRSDNAHSSPSARGEEPPPPPHTHTPPGNTTG
jgi:hypothetical protein